MAVERIKITPNQFTCRDSNNNVVFDTNNRYLKTDATGSLLMATAATLPQSIIGTDLHERGSMFIGNSGSTYSTGKILHAGTLQSNALLASGGNGGVLYGSEVCSSSPVAFLYVNGVLVQSRYQMTFLVTIDGQTPSGIIAYLVSSSDPRSASIAPFNVTVPATATVELVTPALVIEGNPKLPFACFLLYHADQTSIPLSVTS